MVWRHDFYARRNDTTGELELFAYPKAFIGEHGRNPSLNEVHAALRPFAVETGVHIDRKWEEGGQPQRVALKVWKLDRAELDKAGVRVEIPETLR